MESRNTGWEAPVAESPNVKPGAAPRIDTSVFARKREALQGQVPLASMARLLTAGVAPEGSVDWCAEGSVARDEMQRRREFLRVRLSFSPWMSCSRCLDPVRVSDLASDSLFRMAASETQAAQEDRGADAIEVIAASPKLDLAALVEDEAILALPMAPAHLDCMLAIREGSENDADV